PVATADGVRIRLDANIEFADDLATARYAGAEGIGLYRSEFLLTDAPGRAGGMAAISALDDEDRQYEIYRGMVEGMAPGTLTVRTFDIDEDQLGPRVSQFPLAPGWEPEVGRARRQGR